MVEKEELKRDLKNRHIQMIAIGGAIGAGLFYGSAGAIGLGGPAVSLAFLIGGIFIFMIVRALGEMSVAEPVSGSFSSYATRYLGHFAGFYSGWTYWYVCVTTVMAEITVLGIYVQYWYPNAPKWLVGLAFLVAIVAINLINVKAYGEFEFWFALIKVVAIILMIIFGLAMILFGLGNGGNPVGFSNLWTHGGYFATGLKGFLLAFIMVAFSFGGVEMVGLTAGEAKDPTKTIPKAVNGVFWRILLFYVGAILVMVTLYPWNKIGTEYSPFVLVFGKMGIPYADSVINFVVLTAALSGMNSCMYGVGRLMYSLALNNNAPKIFTKVNARGVPSAAIIFSTGVALIAVVMNYLIPAKVFVYISSVTTIGIIIGWTTILVAQLKFRKVKMAKGEELAFKMPFWPISNYLALIFLACIVVIMGIIPDTRIALYVAPFWSILLVILYRSLNKENALQAVQSAKHAQTAQATE